MSGCPTGNAIACKQLVRERAPDIGKQLLRKVWGVRKVHEFTAIPKSPLILEGLWHPKGACMKAYPFLSVFLDRHLTSYTCLE